MNANRTYIMRALTTAGARMEISRFPLYVKADLAALIADGKIKVEEVTKPSHNDPWKIMTYRYVSLNNS